MDEKQTDDENQPDVGTTHAEWGAGSPRLIISDDEVRSIYDISTDRVSIGSAQDNDIVVPNADPVHATVEHDPRDEYVLVLHGPGEMNANPDAAATSDGSRTETLRTGARFTVAGTHFVFQRDEFADHGRPYGGREGGELSDQPLQPPRPDYAAGEQGAPDWVPQDPTS